MGRTLPRLGEELVGQIERAWAKRQEPWARKRLQVVRLVGQHELTVAQIMKVCDVSRQTVFTYRDTVVSEGVEGLLRRKWAGGVTPVLRGALEEEFVERLEEGKFRRAADAQAWIRKRTRKHMSESGVRKVLRRLGGKLKVPRKSHAKKNKARMEQFKQQLPAKLSALAANEPSVRIWVLDEHRYGLLPVIRRVWARPGTRVTAPYQTRYKWGYLHEALEVDGAHACELLFTPSVDRDIHAIFLQQIAQSDPGSMHVIIEDQAGFHLPENDARIPGNVRILPLPPYSPELNPVERFGGLIKQAVSNRLYPTLERLEKHIEAAARQWAKPEKVAGLIHQWLADKANCGAPT
ncbi:IS630 family transposase [Opitutaceae bacterium TAV4]|nr:IS630 family transposase [Opitutaceae bacterium TAV4]